LSILSRHPPMLRFFLLFLSIQAVLFVLELWQPVREAVIIPFTAGLAALSAWLVGLFDDGVVASGIVLTHVPNNFAVRIEAGCNGVEAMIILIAAILAFPASWKHKVMGLTLGFVAIQALNLARIISLFYIGQWNYAVFEWSHLYLWQALILLDALIFWLVWVRMLPGGGEGKSLFAMPEPAVAAVKVDSGKKSKKSRRRKR
jgi:exosortase H (IPTLxxWG-CTERM-specific)